MAVVLRKRACTDGFVSLYLDIHFKGVRRYEYLGLKIRENPRNVFEANEKKEKWTLAKRIALQKESELIAGVHALPHTHKTDIDFFGYFQRFIEDNRDLVDIRSYITTLNKLKEFSGRTTLYCQEVTEPFLEKFAKYLQKKHSGETPYNYFKKLKRVLKEVFKDKLLRFNPATDIHCPKKKGIEKDVLTIEELTLLESAYCGNSQVKNAFLFCCSTGLRFCDVKALMWKHVKAGSISLKQQKTGEQISMSLSEDARHYLPSRKEVNERVFILPSHNACLKNLRNWVKNAGVEKHITWHCARHSFGTNLIKYGADVLITSKLLGHTSTKFTTRYVRVSEDLKTAAINRIPSVIKSSTI